MTCVQSISRILFGDSRASSAVKRWSPASVLPSNVWFSVISGSFSIQRLASQGGCLKRAKALQEKQRPIHDAHCPRLYASVSRATVGCQFNAIVPLRNPMLERVTAQQVGIRQRLTILENLCPFSNYQEIDWNTTLILAG